MDEHIQSETSMAAISYEKVRDCGILSLITCLTSGLCFNLVLVLTGSGVDSCAELVNTNTSRPSSNDDTTETTRLIASAVPTLVPPNL